MKRIIIHIGPPKCGSTSIQDFFFYNKNPCLEKIKLIRLNFNLIESLNTNHKIAENEFIDLIKKEFILNDVLILSQEVIFFLPKVIEKICSLSLNIVSKIQIIGYSRKSSDFLVSLYHQSTFKNLAIKNQSQNVLLENKITPSSFFGIEKFLILTILNNFSSNTPIKIKEHIEIYTVSQKIEIPLLFMWEDLYSEIKKSVSKLNVNFLVGTLPTKKPSKTLIQDFCSKAKLTLKKKYEKLDQKSNPKFNEYLTESLNNTINFNLEIPKINRANHIFRASNLMKNEQSFDHKFISQLKEYIDVSFYKSNIKFCSTFGLDKEYFAPKIYYSKKEILKLIKAEMHSRKSSNLVLEKYREINSVLTDALYHSFKDLKKEVDLSSNKNSVRKIKGIKLLWNKTPEPIRKKIRKVIGYKKPENKGEK